jgi:hypothetical protein
LVIVSSNELGAGELDRYPDVSRLSALIATSEKNDQLLATSDEVDPVARPPVDPQLRDPCAYLSNVAWVAK